MKKRSYIVFILLALAVFAGALTGAYYVGKGQSMKQVKALEEEVEELQTGVKDAVIVKRVSQQMEDIAYQQKAISDEQRDRAEEQSALAVLNAARAEQESRAAHQAEGKAKEAAQEAQQQRAYAEQQQQIALEQRDHATHAKHVADTLNVRTQARILGVTSQIQRESGDFEVADLLAYTSWYFLKTNRGNQYFSDTFKALTQATGETRRYRMRQNGAVNAISEVPGTPHQCVAVSNYGEVELLMANDYGNKTKTISSRTLLYNKEYDFRDVLANKQCVYALSQKGTLCIIDYQSKVTLVSLPVDAYFKIVQVGSRLLLAARQKLCWYEAGNVSSSISLPKTLSAIVKREDKVCLFYADGSYAEMNGAGKIENKTPLVKGVVTAAHYDKATECLSLGVKDGTVYPVNKYNRAVETLAAHKSRCASIAMQGSTIITGGYDKNVFLWHMDNLLFESGMNFREEMQIKSFSADFVRKKEDIPTEWLVPVDYNYDGWTLSVCGDADHKSVWIGTSTGNIIFMNSSADDMAQQLHKGLRRNLTEKEWVRYVGISIPYMKIK